MAGAGKVTQRPLSALPSWRWRLHSRGPCLPISLGSCRPIHGPECFQQPPETSLRCWHPGTARAAPCCRALLAPWDPRPLGTSSRLLGEVGSPSFFCSLPWPNLLLATRQEPRRGTLSISSAQEWHSSTSPARSHCSFPSSYVTIATHEHLRHARYTTLKPKGASKADSQH